MPATALQGAWIQESKADVKFINTTAIDPGSTGPPVHRITCTSAGFKLKAGTPQAAAALLWPADGAGVELVFTGVAPAAWAEPRCGVANVTKTADGGAMMYMEQPCHCSYAYKCLLMTGGNPSVHPPTAIINVGVSNVTNRPGSFWIDKEEKKVYYFPLAGQNMNGGSAVEAMLPVLETLVASSPSPSNSTNPSTGTVSHVRFEGIKFAHTTWYQPTSTHGYVEIQSGQSIDWPMWPGAESGPMLTTPGGAIAFDYAVGIVVAGAEMACLGSAGASFSHAQNVTIDQCYFHDISGAAVQFGMFHGPNASLAPGPNTPASSRVLGNTVSNSVIVGVGAELHGSAGISVGYTAGTTIVNNTIADVPASGISIGWGWGRPGSTSYMADNVVSMNRIFNFRTVMHDGGCIYLQGNQTGTVIEKNWCSKCGPNSGGGFLYPDEGSGDMSWIGNVATDIPSKEDWLHCWVPSVHNQLFAGNFHSSKTEVNKGTNITVINDTLINSNSPPPAAWAIMNASGVVLEGNVWPVPAIPMPPAGPPPTPPAPPSPSPPPPPPPPSPSPPKPPPSPPSPPAPPVPPTPCNPAGTPNLQHYTEVPNTLGQASQSLNYEGNFTCATRQCCPELSAELCDQTPGCTGFALNWKHWFHGLRPQLYRSSAPTTDHHGPDWSFWGRKAGPEALRLPASEVDAFVKAALEEMLVQQ